MAGESGEGTVEEADPSGERHTVLAPRTGRAADEVELSDRKIFFMS